MKKILLSAAALLLLPLPIFAKDTDNLSILASGSKYSATSAYEKNVKEQLRDFDAIEHIYSHRGDSKDNIEHTWQAYDSAINKGSTHLELDVQLSKDGTLYISHDSNTNRITGHNGEFPDMSDATINSLRTKNGEKIHTLQAVLDRYQNQIFYIVEMKDGSQADALISQLQNFKYPENIIVQSFDLEALKKVYENMPELQYTALVRDDAGIEQANQMDFITTVSSNSKTLNEENVKKVHAAGKKFNVWTINSEEDITKAIQLGLDSYYTDDTSLALKLEKELRN